MKERWQDESKWEMAVSTLASLIDSFESVNKDFEIGIRVLGFQYPRTEHRCDDSKLIIPFSKELNFTKVNNILSNLRPQGHTPLAYSIAQSETDFPEDITAFHSIVLITDGLENCDGNPCEVAQRLKEKNIFITPYIIGLGIDSLESEKLECIGKFIDAKNKKVFRNVIQNILTEVSLKTTLRVNFTDLDDNPIPYYVPYSLIDRKTKRDISNFIYTASSKKSLDTIQINQQYVYSLLVHSNPPLLIDTFKLVIGTNNLWTAKFDFGSIDLEPKDKKAKQNYILRAENERSKIYSIPSFNHLLLEEGIADLIEHPNYSKIVPVKKNNPTTLMVFPKGILKIRINDKILASIYDNSWRLVMHLSNSLMNSYELKAGDYYLLYKRELDQVEKSKFQSFQILEGQTLPIAIP